MLKKHLPQFFFALTPVACLLLAGGCPPAGDNNTPAGDNNTPPGGDGTAIAPGIYVTNANSDTVTVYALDATGNAAPVRTIGGSSTGLSAPLGIDIDSQNNIYVANRTGASVTVFPDDAKGDVAPKRVLSAAGMQTPMTVLIGPGDEVFVADCPVCGTGSGVTAVYHFPAFSTTSDSALGGATNVYTGLTNPNSLALDENHNLFVGNDFGGKINVFAPGASGDAFPIRSLAPVFANIKSIAIADQTLFMTSPGIVVDQFPETATGSVSPSSEILPSTALNLHSPGGIVVDNSVTPPVIYLADFSDNAIYVVQTAGTAPLLTVDTVNVITGAGTGLNGPYGLLVVK